MFSQRTRRSSTANLDDETINRELLLQVIDNPLRMDPSSISETKISAARVGGVGLTLVCGGAIGFHEIPGMISEDAEGSKIVNAVYCAVMTLTT